MPNQAIENLPREKLLELLSIYAKNWLAHDGLWFQSIEHELGMDAAMLHDANAWRRFTVIEAKRLKQFLNLPERPGLEGLAQALSYRLYATLNKDCIEIDKNTLTYRVITCRVQSARERKNMPFHPCKSVGEIEYAGFAKTIDDRIRTECVSCHPERTDESACCVWKFILPDEESVST